MRCLREVVWSSALICCHATVLSGTSSVLSLSEIIWRTFVLTRLLGRTSAFTALVWTTLLPILVAIFEHHAFLGVSFDKVLEW